MLILILETSSEKGCIVLADGAAPTAYKILPGGPNLSKCLASEVKNILKDQIPTLIAVGTGPGSYTGIRVGAALAKGLSYGWQMPLIGFCSPQNMTEPDPKLLAELVYRQFLEGKGVPLELSYLGSP